MGWNRLITHPYWGGYEFKDYTIPDQPHYQHFLKQMGLEQEADLTYEEWQVMKQQEKSRQNSLKPKKKNGVDLVRMSQQIKKNMLKEALSNQYQEKQDVQSNDVKLANRDIEINMGKDDREDEEDPLQGDQADDKTEPSENQDGDGGDKFIKLAGDEGVKQKNTTLTKLQKTGS